MDFHLSPIPGASPNNHHSNGGDNHHHHHDNDNNNDPMYSCWESISKARSRIHLLSSLLSTADSSPPPLSSLADSDRPARSLLHSPSSYSAVSSSLFSPSSGSGDDPLCNWLYDTYLSSDADLRLVFLSFIPIISNLYLSRIHSTSSTSPTPSLAGFEAVLLSLYSSETKSRAGRISTISIPDLSQPSLYHNLGNNNKKENPNSTKIDQCSFSIGVLSPPLEPQIAVKSTKRACIIGVSLDCYYKQISQMPSWSKLDFCRSAIDWAGHDCLCTSKFDETDLETEKETLGINKFDNLVPKRAGIPLPWEFLQPVLRILGHCLLSPLNSDDVKDTASVAVRCLYARASHDLVPQVILATQSLIQLDKSAREAAKALAAANADSNASTPSKAKIPQILLVSNEARVCMV